ncbi:DNA polymerase II subunit B3-1-like protein [Drosera capensis]
MKTFTRRKDAAATIIKPHKSDDNTTTHTQKQHHINGQSIVLVMPSQSPSKKKNTTEKEKKSDEEVTKKKKRKKESEVKEETGETVKRGKAELGEGAVATSGFPVSRVDRIVRSEGAASEFRITSEAVFLIKNATEKFLEAFSADSYASAIRDRKKSLGYKHLSTVVSKEKRFDFLSDFVPEKVKAEKALSEMKLSGTSPG